LQALGGTESGANDNNNTAASDHLPIVADYDIDGLSAPEPSGAVILLLGAMTLMLMRRRRAQYARTREELFVRVNSILSEVPVGRLPFAEFEISRSPREGQAAI
jgi:hypothetical protein